MVDPELVAIGAEAPARLTDLGVMPEPGGEALVGDDGEAGERDPLEHLARDLSLGSICRGELEGDRGPVARAEQIEAKAPEVARVRAAVAVGCDPRELGAPNRLARGRARGPGSNRAAATDRTTPASRRRGS